MWQHVLRQTVQLYHEISGVAAYFLVPDHYARASVFASTDNSTGSIHIFCEDTYQAFTAYERAFPLCLRDLVTGSKLDLLVLFTCASCVTDLLSPRLV